MEFGMAAPADGRVRGLGFARRVVGIGAGGVVGRVQDLDDLGDLILDEPLDARLQGDVRGAAPLAAAAHLEVDPVVLHVDQLDVAAVAGDRRVDHGVDQLLDPGLQFVAHGDTSQTATVPEIPLRANWPSVGSAQQNHGSVRRGGRVRSGGCAASGRGGAPAVSSASWRIRLNVAVASSRASAAPATSTGWSAAKTSARECPLARFASTVSESDSAAVTMNAQPRSASSRRRARWFSRCSTFAVKSNVTEGSSACSARATATAWPGPFRKSGSPNVMCDAPASTCWRMSASTTSRGTTKKRPP